MGLSRISRQSTARGALPLMWKKLGWMMLIWAASVAALGVVAYGLKLLMNAAGLID
jgi:hypothetical protein